MLPYSDLDLVLLRGRRPGRACPSMADQLWYPDLGCQRGTRPQRADGARGNLAWRGGSVGGSRAARRPSHRWRRGPVRPVDRGDPPTVAQGCPAPAATVDRARRTALGAGRRGRAPQRARRQSGRGGLRDVQLLNALALAQLTDGLRLAADDAPGGGLGIAYRRLLDVRTELHRVAGAQPPSRCGPTPTRSPRHSIWATASLFRG